MKLVFSKVGLHRGWLEYTCVKIDLAVIARVRIVWPVDMLIIGTPRSTLKPL